MIPHYASKFGQQLKVCRQKANVTQEELAGYIDKDSSLISHYERGDVIPDRERLYDLIRFFREKGVPNDYFEKLFELGGYNMAKDYEAPVINRIVSLLDILEQDISARSLFVETLEAVVDDWIKYCNALKDLKRSSIQDAQEGFSELLPEIDQELPLRQRLSIHVNLGLAKAWRYLGEPLHGLDFINTAINIAEALGESEKETLARLLLERGNFYRRLNDWDKAKNDFINSRQVFRKLERTTKESKDHFIAIVERKLAGTLLFQGQPKKALEHCSHSINICRDLADREQECKGLQHRAWALALIGQWDEALEIHKGVINTFTNLGASTILMSKSYLYLADVYEMCGVLEKAEANYDEALTHLKKYLIQKGEFEGDKIIYGSILHGKGSVYRLSGSKYSQAKALLEKGLKNQLQLKARLHEALTRSELGKLILETGDFNQAKSEIDKAKEIFEKLDNRYHFVAQLVNLSELEFRRKNFSAARSLITRAIDDAEEQGFDIHLVRAKLQLAEINALSPDNSDPLELYSSALQKARELNPFLTHEVLSRIAGHSHTISDDDNINEENLHLCNLILERGENVFKGKVFTQSGLRKWLEEIDQVRAGLEELKKIPPFKGGYGLFVGIGAYQHLKQLEKTTFDARDFHDLLSQNQYLSANLTLLLDEQATKGAIGNELDLLTHKAAAQDTVVIFFSGHGAQRIGGFEKGEYLCTVETDLNKLKTTAISNEDLTSAIRAIKARQVVVFLDACHSGGVGEPKTASSSTKAGLSEGTYEQLASGEGRVVIASCKPNEVSWELAGMRNGLFTHFLLEGLRGAAGGKNGGVGVLNLFDYISRLVPTRADQHPLFKGEVDNNFPIIPN